MSSLKRQRVILMASGALLGLALVLTAVVLAPQPAKQHRQALAGCKRYFLIPVERVCGKNVFWTNPDGSRVLIGKTSQMVPMPRARPAQEKP